MSATQSNVVQVAVPVPLRRLFDYQHDGEPLPPGARVTVPFGSRTVIGVVVSNEAPQSSRKLKSIGEVVDADNVFGDTLFSLLRWAAQYYHHSLGDVLQTALPVALRKGKPLDDPNRCQYMRAVGVNSSQSDAKTPDALLARAPLQSQIYQHLADAGWVAADTIKKQFPNSTEAIRGLQKKNLLEIALRQPPPPDPQSSPNASRSASDQVTLNPEQQSAADEISRCFKQYASFLLHGITGSGKTEVYLDIAQQCIAAGSQVLILVPEIALTPQLVNTVQARLGDDVCVLHSALSAEKRYRAWWRARQGHACAVLGTRSAVFTPLQSPGLIVVDEEHDISYKQQNGFRYHARDLAIKRASMENIPIVLGSATPSMETHHNAQHGRHQLLHLSSRAGAATLPRIHFINIQEHKPVDGISMPLLQAIKQRIAKREQSILFLNRRGFAPIAMCHRCGWQASCPRCDARLTYHRDLERFRCHHCQRVSKANMVCDDCDEPIIFVGAGTQRLQGFLKKQFPEACISRLDRDQVTTQKQLELELENIRLGKTDIIIGTQLIAKGHDFSKVTLVGVINSDQGLYSIDFRAPEYLFQQLTQVSGRAGRATAPGEVLIQTAHPDHPTMQHIRSHDFVGFANHCQEERSAANYPPFSHIALWRAESTQKTAALQFLRHVATVGKQMIAQQQLQQVQISDAVISPMEKLAGKYRAQLMVRGTRRMALHQLLSGWVDIIESDPKSKRARWSLDVDPMDMFDPMEIF